jgi:hypothetical protein
VEKFPKIFNITKLKERKKEKENSCPVPQVVEACYDQMKEKKGGAIFFFFFFFLLFYFADKNSPLKNTKKIKKCYKSSQK